MTEQYRSPVMASVHETAKGLHAAGVMDEQTMRVFDEACLPPGERDRQRVSQAQFAVRPEADEM